MYFRSTGAALVLTAQAALIAIPQTAIAQDTLPATQEQAQPGPSGVHAAIRWAQIQLDEIDATIAALEADADKLQGDLRAQAQARLDELRATRDAYRASLEAAVADTREGAQAQFDQIKAELDARRTTFEEQVGAYITAAQSEVETTRRAVLLARLEAQRVAAQQVVDDLRTSAAKLADDQRAAIEARIAELQARIAEGQQRLEELSQAGNEAWASLVKGLDEARNVLADTYDDINETIADALK